jgi:hypothetical protein
MIWFDRIRNWFLRVWYCHHNARVIEDFERRMSLVLCECTRGMSKPYYSIEAMRTEIQDFLQDSYDEGYRDGQDEPSPRTWNRRDKLVVRMRAAHAIDCPTRRTGADAGRTRVLGITGCIVGRVRVAACGGCGMSEPPECPRCAELRGRCVRMRVVKNGARNIPTAYECPSCDYMIPLQLSSVDRR